MGMAVYTYSSSTWEAEAGRLRVQGQPKLHSELDVSWGYIARPCLRGKKRCTEGKKKKKKQISRNGEWWWMKLDSAREAIWSNQYGVGKQAACQGCSYRDGSHLPKTCYFISWLTKKGIKEGAQQNHFFFIVECL
jgi:hypothetical protein